MQISWQRYSATSLTSPCLQALFSFYVRHHCVFPQENCYHQLNDYRPVALTSTVMKCCEKLVLRHIKSSLPPTLDQHQFAYRANRSTEDTINTALSYCNNPSGTPGDIHLNVVWGLKLCVQHKNSQQNDDQTARPWCQSAQMQMD